MSSANAANLVIGVAVLALRRREAAGQVPAARGS